MSCLEEKLHAPSFKTSQTKTATIIGEAIHMDIVRLKTKTAGGNTKVHVAICKTSGYGAITFIRTKDTEVMQKAMLNTIVSQFTVHGHRVKIIITVAEHI